MGISPGHLDAAGALSIIEVVGLLLLLATGALLAAWGVFVHLNRSAEELEPEAMVDVKCEDEKLR